MAFSLFRSLLGAPRGLKELRQELSTLRGGQERAVSEARRQTSALRSTQEDAKRLGKAGESWETP